MHPHNASVLIKRENQGPMISRAVKHGQRLFHALMKIKKKKGQKMST